VHNTSQKTRCHTRQNSNLRGSANPNTHISIAKYLYNVGFIVFENISLDKNISLKYVILSSKLLVFSQLVIELILIQKSSNNHIGQDIHVFIIYYRIFVQFSNKEKYLIWFHVIYILPSQISVNNIKICRQI